MLKVLKLEKIGFNNSLKLNDMFDYDGHSWLVRAIPQNRIKARYINLGGKTGWQHDVIEATVVAQELGTFDESNRVSKETEITSTYKTANVNNLSSHENCRIIKVGDVCDLGDNAIYLATEVLEIKYSFVDVVIKLKGISVTELPLKENQKLMNQHRLNELGWSVI
ncbi:hypothetical protein [Enterococcus faecalis]|uniref:hypothetical protein n=2 Tax=Enterococcus faecalis TaxID=1351 RepID=UPI0004A73DD3|nr:MULTISPECIES: hypothetical protein [Bacteria]EJG3828634.1 hypothetical protein [Listeria monocytogenes]MDU6989855.1 hypothetical protein [Escherichia coli]EGO2601788.1 hypothetical protein [Enterococcus faecalis]EGO7961105.1 hypothetical protein [Enterococcus faecalis]EGO8497466.1 hypothetical protein [Enterococcus faecalis]